MERKRGKATRKERMWLYKFKIPGVVGDESCMFELTWAVRKKATRFLPMWPDQLPRYPTFGDPLKNLV